MIPIFTEKFKSAGFNGKMDFVESNTPEYGE